MLLATVATVIASQALISGAFSLVSQAIGLGLFPRIAILHTHHSHAGQIYIPVHQLGALRRLRRAGRRVRLGRGAGAAYGLAVSGVMVITSVAMIADRAALLALERGAHGAGVGAADGASTAPSSSPAR